MKPTIKSALVLLVRTTEYVSMAPVRNFREQRYLPSEHEVANAIGHRPSSPWIQQAMDPATGLMIYSIPPIVRGERTIISSEQVAEIQAKHAKAMARWNIKRAKFLRANKAAADAVPFRDRRYGTAAGVSVLGRNFAARIRVMQADHLRRLTSIDKRIAALQAQRKVLLEQAWDAGHPVNVDDLDDLAKRANAPAARNLKQMGERELDHRDLVWPASLHKKSAAA